MTKEKIPYWKNKDLNDISDTIDGIFYSEEWRFIDNCDGQYMVSDFGRLKSLKRDYLHPIKGVVKIKEKILSQYLNGDGYCKSQLSINRIKVKVYVHRLVGHQFIDNPENKPQINHKKGITSDNFFTHIEWSTNSENNKHAYRELGRVNSKSRLGKTGALHPQSKPLFCPTLGLSFESAKMAQRILGVAQGSISKVCNGTRLHAEGLVFNYI